MLTNMHNEQKHDEHDGHSQAEASQLPMHCAVLSTCAVM